MADGRDPQPGDAPGPRPDEPRGPLRPADLIFVGGTGRSGTHVVAHLLERHSRYAMFPLEARFHVNPKGIGDLLSGVTGIDEFTAKLRGFWWKRRMIGRSRPALARALREGPKRRGLSLAVEPEAFEAAVERFERDAGDDLPAACRRLVLDLLWPTATVAAKPGLVEMSSFNVTGAPALARLFPEARFIHSVRDGRDAGSSKVAKREKRHHPRSVEEGIGWWAGRIDAIEQSAAELASGTLLVLCLDELVGGDREAEYSRLCSFLEIEDEPAMREFFEQQMSAGAANRERWRRGLSEAEAARITERYEQELERMQAAGYLCAPVLRRALHTERPATHTIGGTLGRSVGEGSR